MLEGLSEIVSRVNELQSALDPASSRLAGSSTSTQSVTASGSSGSSSFQQSLQHAQSGMPAHMFSVGPNGATQMPQAPTNAAAGTVGAATTNASSLDGLGGLDTSASGGLSSLGGLDTTGANGLAGLTDPNPLGSGGLSALGGIGGGSALDPGMFGDTSSTTSGSNGNMLNLLDNVAKQVGVDPALAKAVAQSESGFNPSAVSPAGATGLMQLMPSTFQQYAVDGSTPSGWPTQGPVSQQFGPTSYSAEPPLEWNGQYYGHFHTGLDIAVQSGTPIHATMGGTIELRKDPEGFGNMVVIRNGPWDVFYGHTSGHPPNIKTGATVKPGDVVGFAGSTGNSSGPHIHYEIRRNGEIVDPSPFLGQGSSTANPKDPVANAKAGVGYLKDLLTKYNNNVPTALAAYNAGPGAVQKYGGIPPYPETQAYVQKTMQNARNYSA